MFRSLMASPSSSSTADHSSLGNGSLEPSTSAGPVGQGEKGQTSGAALKSASNDGPFKPTVASTRHLGYHSKGKSSTKGYPAQRIVSTNELGRHVEEKIAKGQGIGLPPHRPGGCSIPTGHIPWQMGLDEQGRDIWGYIVLGPINIIR